MKVASALAGAALAFVAASPAARADPATNLARGKNALDQAQAAKTVDEARKHARQALEHFEASHAEQPSWEAAGGVADSHVLLGQPALASAWYWVASDASDYSPSYLAWQKGALDRIFQKRAAITFELNEPARSVKISGAALPPKSFDRALAFDPGKYRVAATSETGRTFDGELVVEPRDVGASRFFPVELSSALPAGEDAGGVGGPRKHPPKPREGGFSALQIATIVATCTLATGSAIGGGYLLLGGDNPKGLDTPEGVAVIAVELTLVAGGTIIAIFGD